MPVSTKPERSPRTKHRSPHVDRREARDLARRSVRRRAYRIETDPRRLIAAHGRNPNRHDADGQARKRGEIEAAIANYEARLARARADLSYVNACIAISEACDEPSGPRAYVDLHRLSARGEMMRMCKESLASGQRRPRSLL